MKIKNIILDVGGILFDDSKINIEKVLNKNYLILLNIIYVAIIYIDIV